MLALLFALLTPAPACDAVTQSRVVGWSADGSVALVRSATESLEGLDLDLVLIDLASSKIQRTLRIMDPGETAQDRGRRWKAAEAELTGEGFSILPKAAPSELETAIPGLLLSWSKRDAAGTIFWDLMAIRGERSATVARNVWYQPPTPMDTLSVDGPWISPGHRWLLFLQQGCGEEFTVVSADYVRGLLDSAE